MDENTEQYEFFPAVRRLRPRMPVWLLGGVLQDPNVLAEVVPFNRSGCFFMRSAIASSGTRSSELYKNSTPIDAVTLSSALESAGKLEAVGGKAHILQLIESVASAAVLKWHADIIQKGPPPESHFRVEPTIRDALVTLRRIRRTFFRPRKRSVTGPRGQARPAIAPGARRREHRPPAARKRKGGLTGCPTGFKGPGQTTNGLQPSDLIILARRRAWEKTAFALTLASGERAINNGKKVARSSAWKWERNSSSSVFFVRAPRWTWANSAAERSVRKNISAFPRRRSR